MDNKISNSSFNLLLKSFTNNYDISEYVYN